MVPSTRRMKNASLAFFVSSAYLSRCPLLCAYTPSFRDGRTRTPFSARSIAEHESVPDAAVLPLKEDLPSIARKTRRGFRASREERQKIEQIVRELSRYNPAPRPAAAYFGDERSGYDRPTGNTLSGKWTLIYTDAPDITSLEGGPLSPAKLGRIGQQCSPPFIKNVIEWKRPDWAASLPFSGNESSRILQKVCCTGSADASDPAAVNLKLVGLEITADAGEKEGGVVRSSGPAAFFENFPVSLEGPLSLAFGRFEVLYLDRDMRITKTFQGFTAVNVRDETEWF